MSDWICYGQTTIPANSVSDNPTPNTAGVVGEINTLPYTVPVGKTLTLTAFGIEGNPETTIAAIIPWLGTPPITNAKCLMSISSDGGSKEMTGMSWDLPAGTILNARLVNGTSAGFAFGWFMRGDLLP